MRILVTGGAGFIGKRIAERYIEEGHEVRILDNFSTGKEGPKGAEVIKGDIQDREIVKKAIRDMDIVNHHAALISVTESIKDPIKTWKINILGTNNLLEASVKEGVKKFILASSAAVYGEQKNLPIREDAKPFPLSPYAESKLMNEISAKRYNEEYGLSVVIFRYFNVYGPGQNPDKGGVIPRFILAGLKNKKINVYGDGKQTRDFVYIDDVAEANLLGIKAKISFEMMNIANGKEISLLEVIAIIEEILNKKLDKEFLPLRKGEILRSYANITKAKEILGWTPKVGLKEGIKRTIQWIKNRKQVE